MAFRRVLLKLLARAEPPLRPSSTAALLLPSSVVPDSLISPVAIFMTWTAFDATSAGRLWPLGVLGISAFSRFRVFDFFGWRERSSLECVGDPLATPDGSAVRANDVLGVDHRTGTPAEYHERLSAFCALFDPCPCHTCR
jgi:hypothetical protein